ncbi:MAG: DNA-3-methyladenine glycosylase [Arachnia sp.]
MTRRKQVPLQRSRFYGPAPDLARRLLGCFLTTPSVRIRITEVEAYLGAEDPGSHAYRGRTRRNRTMFGPGGHLYVYRHLGLHTCCNVVAGPAGQANGCLIRAGEVVHGVDVARQRRATAGVTRSDTDLAQGPGRLCVALGILIGHDGLDLCAADSPVWLTERTQPPAVTVGPRVGLRPEATSPLRLQLRFSITGDPTVSRAR